MRDSLPGSRHHRVVSRNNNNSYIGNLSTAGTHGRESLVSGRIEEGYLTTTFQRNAVSSNMLGNTSRLAGDDICIADVVEQRGFSMVNMAHDGDNRRPWHELALIIYLLAYGLLNLRTHVFGLETKLFSHHIYGFCVEPLVDRGHDSDAHQRRNNFGNAYIHHRSQLADGYKFSQLQRLAFLLFSACLCIKLLLNGLSLFLTVFGSSLILRLAGQSGQRLLYLTCHVFFVNLERFLCTFVVLSTAFSALSLCWGILYALRCRSVYVDTPSTYALTLPVFAAALLTRFFLAVLAFFFFRTLLWTRTLVKSVKINLT